ncbi:MAG: DciA family protein [Polyangia bacterium]
MKKTLQPATPTQPAGNRPQAGAPAPGAGGAPGATKPLGRTLRRVKRRRRKDARPERGWGLIRDAANRLGLWPQLAPFFVQRAFALAMRKLVPRLQTEARAEGLQGDGLVVRVSSSAVASELLYVRDLLLEQVNEELDRLRGLLGSEGASTAARGLRKVVRLVHRVGPVAELPDATEWTRVPRPRKRPLPKRPPARPEEEAELVAALGTIGDGTLRDALGALYLSARRSGR